MTKAEDKLNWTTGRLTILHAATHETELGDHDLSQLVTLCGHQSGRPQWESNPGLLTRSRALYRLSYRAPRLKAEKREHTINTKRI